MTNIQLSIEDTLIAEIDRVIKPLAITRADFVRDALASALRQYEIRLLEKEHEEGYRKYPVMPGEFDGWESEQVWEVP